MCTDLILPYADPYVSGRTMDFGGVLNARICKIPVGHHFKPSEGQEGKDWKGKYGFVAINYQKTNMYSDGLNTEGLSVGLLWLNKTRYRYCQPNPLPPNNEVSQCVAITDSVAYFLGTCATVKEVKKALDDIIIWGCIEKELGPSVPALHIVAHDAKGYTLVVEILKEGDVYGENVCYGYHSIDGYDNWINPQDYPKLPLPTGVLTNDPTFDKQLADYDRWNSQKRPIDHPENGEWPPIPGGISSKDRFIRGSYLRSCVPEILPYSQRRKHNPAKEKRWQRTQFVVQLLNRLEVTQMDANGQAMYTIWSIVRDHTNRILYWFNNMNHNLRAVELDELNFENGRDDEVYLNVGDWYTPFNITLSR